MHFVNDWIRYSSSRKHRVTQYIIIISSDQVLLLAKHCPSVAEQQLHSWLGNQMMRPKSPFFFKWCSYRSSMLVAQTVQSVGFLYYCEDHEVKEKVVSNAI
ncbi:hypothetical protein CEXT_521861 [Caerostris extrusa]|uniref:Uncharacterized protein n=1 Tax=Caerostris extrusa TaxID=172846 RepID=A0AAV4XXD0_CAEEX|nr:hypothetical protein CEXT_521861 [Caerostris extrusa]